MLGKKHKSKIYTSTMGPFALSSIYFFTSFLTEIDPLRYTIEVNKSPEMPEGGQVKITYLCNDNNEPMFIPDQSLAILLCVNLSTLRGRLNTLAKGTLQGSRHSFGPEDKARVSSQVHYWHVSDDQYILKGVTLLYNTLTQITNSKFQNRAQSLVATALWLLTMYR